MLQLWVTEVSNVIGRLFFLNSRYLIHIIASLQPLIPEVIVVTPGNFCGEHSLLTGRLRNTTAKCIDPNGCTALLLLGRDFRKLMDVQPKMKESLVDMMNRRDFKKAVVFKL